MRSVAVLGPAAEALDVSRPARVRVPASALGWHRLTRVLLLTQVLCGLVSAWALWATGLKYAWWELTPTVASATALLAVFGVLVAKPGRNPREWVVAEMLLAAVFLVTLGAILAPSQYAAVALRRPLVDSWLAAADAAIGVHVPSLAEWTLAHPAVRFVLTVSYNTFLPQQVLPIVILAGWYRDRVRLWEFVALFHVCLIVTIACLAIWPAACAFTYYGFDSLLDQTRFIRQFDGLRLGTFATVQPSDIEGLISMPSFHAAGAILVTWAFRGYRRWFIGLAVVNAALIASTFMTGAHYVVDVLASLVLCAGSIVLWRRVMSRWV